jgi:hypothetical protein
MSQAPVHGREEEEKQRLDGEEEISVRKTCACEVQVLAREGVKNKDPR